MRCEECYKEYYPIRPFMNHDDPDVCNACVWKVLARARKELHWAKWKADEVEKLAKEFLERRQESLDEICELREEIDVLTHTLTLKK